MKTIIIDGTEYSLTPVVKEEVFNDWRLPTIKELLTLINFDKHSPASDLEDTKDYYWSSSTLVHTSDYAWVVDFNYGDNYKDNKSNNDLVRCVRDGDNGLEWSATSKDTMTWYEAIKYAENLVAPVYYKG